MLNQTRCPLAYSMLAVLALLGATGCGGGDSGPPRLHLRGAITFDGQPIPVGTITFVPDAAKGNHGPAGNATIVNGNYSTEKDSKGIVGGPHVLRIAAFDGQVNMEAELPMGQPLFPEYELQVDLPTLDSNEDGTFDLAVPKEAADSKWTQRSPANDV